MLQKTRTRLLLTCLTALAAGLTPVAAQPAPSVAREADFEGDGKADTAVFHPGSGLWFVKRSSDGGVTTLGYGGAASTIVPADYDGDGRIDPAVYYEASGLWYARLSSNGTTRVTGFGGPGYKPVPRDYDGDGLADLAVFHLASGLWYVKRSSDNVLSTLGYGSSNARPVPGDYDGDGRADRAVYYEATGLWYVRQSSTGTDQVSGFGGTGYEAVPGDYDGDGKADRAVRHVASGIWFVKRSSDGGVTTLGYGGSTAIAAPADYDGDGKTDIAVYYPSGGLWYARLSSTGADRVTGFGGTAYVPVNSSPASAAFPTASQMAARIGRPAQFLFGIGNESEDVVYNPAYNTSTLDLYYRYLVGLPGEGGWPDWNPNGTYVDIVAAQADTHGAVPLFTLYQMAAWGDGNLAGLTNTSYMQRYWDSVKLLFQRLAVFGKPAVVHFEPDFLGYCMRQNGLNPANTPVLVSSVAPNCQDLPNDLTGMGRCFVRLARTYAPKTLVGFDPTAWGADNVADIAPFVNAIGAAETDVMFAETLDRDAGCFEAHALPECQRTEGNWYWDETNTTSPTFHEHFAWVKTVHDGLRKPVIWWQTPLGVPSGSPGGSPGHYRDNRVHYFFGHVQELVDAGGLGVCFGTGAGNQTDITTDGGQFRDAAAAYYQAPVAIP